MKLSINTNELKKKLDFIFQQQKIAHRKKMLEIEEYNKEVDSCNERMKKVAESYTEEDLKRICESYLKEETIYTEVRYLGIFWKRVPHKALTLTKNLDAGRYLEDGKGLKIESNSSNHKYNFFTYDNEKEVYSHPYKVKYLKSDGNIESRCRYLRIYYHEKCKSKIYDYKPSPELTTLWDNTLLAEKHGLREVVLEEKDLELLNKCS